MQKNILFIVGVLKVTDEKSRIRSRFRICKLETRIRGIQIRTEMSQIRNTGQEDCPEHQKFKTKFGHFKERQALGYL
jgi:hypothetical protein